MRIKDVEELVGVTKKNIRFYEKEGLLFPGRNAENSYRDYSMDDVRRLKEIKLLRKLDMPISEIRDLIEGRVSLVTATTRHIAELDGRMANISQARAISERISRDGTTVSELDVEGYLMNMELKEKEGILFVNIKNKDTGKKLAGPVIACLCVVLAMAGVICMMLWGHSVDPLPEWLLAVLIAIPVVVSLGTVAALVSRIKEIRKGEENDLGKY